MDRYCGDALYLKFPLFSIRRAGVLRPDSLLTVDNQITDQLWMQPIEMSLLVESQYNLAGPPLDSVGT